MAKAQTILTNIDATSSFVADEAACLTLSVDDIEKQGFKCYPNPTHSFITLILPMESNTEVHYSIYNNVGQVLEQKSVVGVTQLDVDLSNYKAGIYFIGLKTENNNYIQRIIKKD